MEQLPGQRSLPSNFNELGLLAGVGVRAGVQVTGHLSVFEHMAPELNSARILIVDDEEDILLAARLLLKRHFAFVQTSRDPSLLPDLVRNGALDVLLLDMNFAAGADYVAEVLMRFL
jgi:hypothetical protein